MIDPVDNLDEVSPPTVELETSRVAIETSRLGHQATQTTREGETAGSADPSSGLRFAPENIRKFGLVALDAGAAGLFGAATQLSSPLPIKVTATLSGSLWTGAAFIREWDNSARSKVVSSANFLSGAVGVLAMAAPHLAGENRNVVRYASAGGWAVNGAANLVRAIGTSDATIANRVLTGASGLANAAGAALSAASVNAAAENKSADAVKLATASGAMLFVGWAADAAAAWSDRNRSKLPDREHNGLHNSCATGPVVADGPQSDAYSLHSQHSGTSLPHVSTDAPAEGAPPHEIRHLHALHELGDATSQVVADRPGSEARSSHSQHSGTSLPHVSADAPAESAPPHGLRHLHAHYERDGIDGHAVVTEANPPDHHSVHSHDVDSVNAKGPASATENRGEVKYDQRQRNERDGRDP